MKPPKHHTSPRWVKKLLGAFLDPRIAEASLGDLEEKFQHRINQNIPRWKVLALYTLEAIGFLRMTKISRDTSMQTDINVLSHTLLFLFRLIRRDSAYYLISMLGLSVSLVSFLLIMIYIRYELSFDRFHSESERIYRVTTHLRLSDVEYNLAATPFPAAYVIESEIEGIDNAVRIYPQQLVFESGNNKFKERAVFADQNFFKVFSFKLTNGDVSKALLNPASVVLTRSAAVRHFGLDTPIGKTLVMDGSTFQVTGVMEDVPDQSHLKFDVIVPLDFQLNQWKKETGLEGRENKWFWIGAYTYTLLRRDATPEKLQYDLAGVVQKYFPERYRENGKFKLQPLADIHLTANLDNELEPGGNLLYVRLFSVVALVIMIVSAINLINLTWFKTSSRIRELGVRKFLGQNPARIVAQLCIESMMLGFTSFLVCMILAVIFIEPFNLLVQKNLNLWSSGSLQLVGLSGALILVICLFAAIRPAIRYASAPGYWMMQRYTNAGTAKLRNVLMGLQVGFSFILLVFSFIVGHQIDFFKNKNLGFDRDNIVVVELNEDVYGHWDAFKAELEKNAEIISVSGGEPPGAGYNGWRFVPEGGSYEKPYLFPLAWVDEKFVETLHIRLLIGENFIPDKDYGAYWPFIINRSAALELGWADDPLYRKMDIFAPGTTEIMAHGLVVGVIEDYHFESLHTPVKPVVLTRSGDVSNALIRISGRNHAEAIAHIERTWKKFSDKTFVYDLLDKKLEKLYANETKLSDLILFFTLIALYLTCYGMFAMSSLVFSSRLREVAIRKVFGADHFTILRQFCTRYTVFYLVAIMCSLPVALYVGNLWLQTFPYRITIDTSFLVRAGALILLAGLLSVSYYMMKIALSNPVKFLKSDT